MDPPPPFVTNPAAFQLSSSTTVARLEELRTQAPMASGTQRQNVLLVDTDDTNFSGELPNHATNLQGVIQLSGASALMNILRCPNARDANTFEQIDVCLDSSRSSNSRVINYSRALPYAGFPDFRSIIRVPDNAVMVIAAGNIRADGVEVMDEGGTIFNGMRAAELDLFSTGRVLIVAGTGTAGGGLHPRSIRCGAVAQEWCLLAPYTVRIVDRNSGDTSCLSGQCFSGTSFSAAVVSGLAATVRGLWPSLTAEQTVDLFRLGCSRDVGLTGVDSITGQGILELGCLFTPAGELRMVGGLPISGTILSGSLRSAGTFSLPAATAYDAYGRDFPVRVSQLQVQQRRSFTEGLAEARAWLYTTATDPANRVAGAELAHPFGFTGEDAHGGALWRRAFGRGLLFGHGRSGQGGNETLAVGTLRPLEAALRTGGTTLERGSFAGGEVTGSGQLALGYAGGLFAEAALPLHGGNLRLTPWVGGMYAHLLHPARGSVVRRLRALQFGTGLYAPWEPTPDAQFSPAAVCRSGLSGQADVFCSLLRLRTDRSCGCELALCRDLARRA